MEWLLAGGGLVVLVLAFVAAKWLPGERRRKRAEVHRTDLQSASTHDSLPRFVCPRASGYRIGPDGYLLDPSDEVSGALQPDVASLQSIDEFSCVILLGEPGIGKSTAIRDHVVRLRTQSNAHVVEMDLLDAHAGGPIGKTLDSVEMKAWRSDDAVLWLHLDALDEALVVNPALGEQLLSWLDTQPRARLRLCMACRTAAWPSYLESGLSELFGEGRVAYLELVPLRQEDVATHASQCGINASEFLDAVASLRAQSLAARPLTLSMLSETFRRHGALPASRVELFREGLLMLCEEQNPRRRIGKAGSLDPYQRLTIASRVAAVMVFCQRTAVWRGALTDPDTPAHALRISQLTGGAETAQGNAIAVAGPQILEALETGLFDSRGRDLAGWTHFAYAEYLTARFLVQRTHDVDRLRQLLMHRDDPGRVVPQLQEVAAWVAAVEPSFFDYLVERDPAVLLRSDVTTTTAVHRSRVVDSLLSQLRQFEIDDRDWGLRRLYSKLDHYALPEQLQPVIVDRSLNVVARRFAIDLARACERSECVPALVAVVEDRDDEVHIRERAAAAVASLGDTAEREALRPALSGALGEDPDDDLKGYALRALWPEELTATELFATLTPPKQRNYLGSYYTFVGYHAADGLGDRDLPTALVWVKSLRPETSWSAFERLAETIVAQATLHLDEPGILTELAAIIRARLKVFKPAFHRRTATERKTLEIPNPSRVRLVAEVLDGSDNPKDAAFQLATRGRELVSVLDTSRLLDEVERRVAAGQSVVPLVELVTRMWQLSGLSVDEAERERIGRRLTKSKSLALHVKPLIDVIHARPGNQLQVAEVTDNDDAWRKASENAVDTALTDSEQGDPTAWLRLCRELERAPNGHRAPARPLDDGEIWREGDGARRARILAAARQFVITTDVPESWGASGGVPLEAACGVAALVLLERSEPDGIGGLPETIWRKWAESLVFAPRPRDIPSRRRLLGLATEFAASETVVSLCEAILRDNAAGRVAWVLHCLPEVLPTSAADRLAALLSNGELVPPVLAALLSALIERGCTPAKQHAKAIVERENDSTLAVPSAVALVVAGKGTEWNVVHRRLAEDDEFADAFLLALEDEVDVADLNLVELLGEEKCAELYISVARRYPDEDDPDFSSGAAPPDVRIRWFRNRLLNQLSKRGTPSSARAVDRIASAFPERQELRFVASQAHRLTLSATWAPISPDEVLRLGTEPQPTDAKAPTVPVVRLAIRGVDSEAVTAVQRMLRDETKVPFQFDAGSHVFRAVCTEQEQSVVREASQSGRIDQGLQLLRLPDATLLSVESDEECLYERMPRLRFREPNLLAVPIPVLRSSLNTVDVLIVTATDIETDAVFDAMEPLPSRGGLLVGSVDAVTLHIGRLGNYDCAHVQCGMGSVGVDSSQLTVSDAIQVAQPCATIVAGIAFGAQPSQQRMGDVLVARVMVPYEPGKVLASGAFEARGIPLACDVILAERFKNRTRDWRMQRGASAVAVHFGAVLSGEKVVNNKEFRTALLRETDLRPIGGEMEGAGAYAAAYRRHARVILVKSICDWADGKKDDHSQPFAAAASVSLIKHVLSQPDVLSPIGGTDRVSGPQVAGVAA